MWWLIPLIVTYAIIATILAGFYIRHWQSFDILWLLTGLLIALFWPIVLGIGVTYSIIFDRPTNPLRHR